MRLAAPIQLFLLALGATQSTASPMAAPADEIEVAARTADESAAVQKRSFTSTCRNCYLDGAWGNDPWLQCECRRPGGQWVRATLVLNKCLANRSGKIAWAVKYVPHILSRVGPGISFLVANHSTITPFLVGTLEEAAMTIDLMVASSPVLVARVRAGLHARLSSSVSLFCLA